MPLLSRAQCLRAYDSHRRDFIDDCRERAQHGACLAGEDVRTLDELASEIAGSLMAWSAIFARLDLARSARGRRPADFCLDRAGQLVVEAVFDELLSPGACRLLTSALDLTLDVTVAGE